MLNTSFPKYLYLGSLWAMVSSKKLLALAMPGGYIPILIPFHYRQASNFIRMKQQYFTLMK
jgi:hypothetical protein